MSELMNEHFYYPIRKLIFDVLFENRDTMNNFTEFKEFIGKNPNTYREHAEYIDELITQARLFCATEDYLEKMKIRVWFKKQLSIVEKKFYPYSIKYPIRCIKVN